MQLYYKCTGKHIRYIPTLIDTNPAVTIPALIDTNPAVTMEGLIPYARGFFYHLPVSLSSMQFNTWHHHIYDKPVKSPTPFFISNILNLESESSDSMDMSGRNAIFANVGYSGHLFSSQTRYPNVIVRSGSPVRLGEKELEGTRVRTNAQSPCMFPRDRVESPQEGL